MENIDFKLNDGISLSIDENALNQVNMWMQSMMLSFNRGDISNKLAGASFGAPEIEVSTV